MKKLPKNKNMQRILETVEREIECKRMGKKERKKGKDKRRKKRKKEKW